MAHEYDIVVLGGGSTGTVVAWYARDNGLSCALVEGELVGGECSYWACIPSKALLRPGEALAEVRRVPGAAAAATGSLDVEAALERRDALVQGWDDQGSVEWLESIGCDFVRGHGRLAGERTVEVEADREEPLSLTAGRAVVIATGGAAAVPPIDGLSDIRYWTNREATAAEEIPRRLVVLGGGVVGVEMAQAHRRLGSEEVTIVDQGERLLSNYEPFAGDLLRDALEDDGVRVLTGRRLDAVERDGDDGPVHARLDDGSELFGEEILVAVGRRPRTDDLGLETVGLEPGGFLDVDERLHVQGVDGDWLYAAGDVNGRALLTHQGKYHARIVADAVAGREGEAWADRVAVPQVVFTDPQVAAVGLTEAQAREARLEAKAVSYGMGLAGAALHGDGPKGCAQIVIDDDRRVIVGATFVGPAVAELLHSATVAITGEVPIERLWHAVPSFPTLSEVWLRLLEAERGVV